MSDRERDRLTSRYLWRSDLGGRRRPALREVVNETPFNAQREPYAQIMWQAVAHGEAGPDADPDLLREVMRCMLADRELWNLGHSMPNTPDTWSMTRSFRC